MKLASVILTTPIILHGIPKTNELHADQDLALSVNWDHGALEIHHRGRLVRVRPLTGVLDMVPAEKQETCPECALRFDDARAMAAHRRFKHGVKGATR